MTILGKGSYNHIMHAIKGHRPIPHTVFNVDNDRKYRFRIISNGILNCPLHLSVDNHTIKAIATDGIPVQAMDVDSMNIFAGERSGLKYFGMYLLNLR